MTTTLRILFMSLGRRGAATRLVRDLASALGEQTQVNGAFVVSRAGGAGADVAARGVTAFELDLFERNLDAFAPWRVVTARRQLARCFRTFCPNVVVDLMPHIWSPLLDGVARVSGVPRAVLLHDWHAHPGDPSAAANIWLRNYAMRADRIIALSTFVASKVREAYPANASKLTTLFHPDFVMPATPAVTYSRLRVHFVGRLFAYKGLDIFVESIEELRRRGAKLDVGVYGSGRIDALRGRLDVLGARISNRWLSEAELDDAVMQCDMLAATYKEASQSGIVAAAHGAGKPVLVTPVGALPEQVQNGRTGFIAARVDAAAVADVLLQVVRDPARLKKVSDTVRAEAPQRSMGAFLRAVSYVAKGMTHSKF